MAALVLDSEGLASWASREAMVLDAIDAALQRGWQVVVPPTAVAEVLRGGPGDAGVYRRLRASRQSFIGPRLARRAGGLLARSGLRGATADAFVVAEAERHGRAIILTSDVADFKALTGGDPRIEVVGV